MSEITEIIGKTPARINQSDDEIAFHFTDGSVGTFYHRQDCCESVTVEDVSGDWSDLVGNPILVADERVNEVESNSKYYYEIR